MKIIIQYIIYYIIKLNKMAKIFFQKMGSSVLLTVNGEEIPLSAAKEEAERLTSVDLRIISAIEGEGHFFTDMTDDIARWSADKILVCTSNLYGCTLPETDFYVSELSKELILMITEYGFGHYTLNEVLLALRLNTLPEKVKKTGLNIDEINFSGTKFNVLFVVQVLIIYSKYRTMLQDKLIRAVSKEY